MVAKARETKEHRRVSFMINGEERFLGERDKERRWDKTASGGRSARKGRLSNWRVPLFCSNPLTPPTVATVISPGSKQRVVIA